MFLSQHDFFIGFVAMATIAIALFIIEWSVKHHNINKLLGRKLLHFTAIATCAFAINFFENRLLLAYTFLIFFFILLWVIRKGWMQVNDYKTYGIALFPLAFATLLFIPVFSIKIIVYAVLLLGISDALAGICGEYFGKHKIAFLFEKKSWVGLLAFYLSSFMISVFYFKAFSFNGFLVGMLLALLPAITELFSYRGSDNFTVPIFAAIWPLLIINLSTQQLHFFLLMIFIFMLLAASAFYKKWLTIDGAVAACWIALLLHSTGGYKAFIAPSIFLISGSLLSKLNKPQKEKQGRNAKQVFANGIVGVVLMVFYGITHQNIYLLAAMVSFSVSMADSTSSEVGVYCKGKVFDILSLKKMPIGVSGGISVIGTFAGFGGAALLSFATVYFYHFSLRIFILITVAGFVGMLLDSILGSWLQAKYKTTHGAFTDDDAGTQKVKGYNWCSNDMVNVLSNAFITLLFLIIHLLVA